MGILITFKENSPPPPLSPPSPPTPTTSWERMTSSLNSRPPSTPPRDPRPEVMPMPPLPRPLPSRTSRRPLPLESSRDSMMDNHSLRSPERKAIEGMQPQINDMERRLGIMQSVEPVLENAIKTLQKVVDVRGMGKK